MKQSQYIINIKKLQSLPQDGYKGSVNITGLPAGEYSVGVYDTIADFVNNKDPVYQQSKLLILDLAFTDPRVSSTGIINSLYSSSESFNSFIIMLMITLL